MIFWIASSLQRFSLHPVRVGLCIIVLTPACKRSSSDCATVRGTVVGQSVPIVDASDAFTGFRVEQATVEGILSGTANATYTIEKADEDGTMHLTGSHTFWDGANEFLFRTRDEGMTTASGRVVNTLTIIEGATGTISTTGNMNLQTGAFTLDYEGEVCRLVYSGAPFSD